MNAPAPVRTAGLTKIFPPGRTAVRSMNLELHRGEVFALLGPNGAGKTTTVGMLTCRVRPTRGQAWISGAPLQDTVAVKRAIGVVSQTNTLDRALNVRENLLAHGWYFGLDSAQARAATTTLLEVFHLGPWADAQVRTLSGGTAQRVMLARAVMHRPAVLFMDEPTTGLDPASRLDAWEQLGLLSRLGQTILLTTHFMDEAERLADRVAIVDHGDLLALGSPAALKAAHGGDSHIRLTASGDAQALVSPLTSSLGHLLTAPPEADGTNAVRLAVRHTDRIAHRVLRIAEEHGAEIIDITVEHPDLERVFLNLTGRSLQP